VRHRAFLRDKARFKQVVPFEDQVVTRKIHQNFHLGFLKDVVLPRALDDSTFAALNQLLFLNNVHIVTSITNDMHFLQGLREKLADEAATAEQLLEALRLLQELCVVTKTLQLFHRAAFYRRLVDHGYFVPLGGFLGRSEPALRLAAIDVLLSSTLHDPSLLRSHMLQQRPNGPMLRALLRVLTSVEASGEKPQITEVLRALLDPDSMEGREQDDFLNLFYESHIHELAQPIVGPAASGREEAVGILTARQHVCELLCFCVNNHSYRIKYFILRNNILFKVLKLASSREKCLVLAALRFFRTCIGLKDEFYNRYIIKNRCFDPVINQLYANRTRDNLLHSACLELFDFVRKENIKSLVAHLSESYKDRLAALDHVDIFKGLLIRHEQNEDFRQMGGGCSAVGSAVVAFTASDDGVNSVIGFAPGGVGNSSVCGRRAFPDEDADSAYFNASDDDEEDGTDMSAASDIDHASAQDGFAYTEIRGQAPVGLVTARLKDSFQVLFKEGGDVNLMAHDVEPVTGQVPPSGSCSDVAGKSGGSVADRRSSSDRVFGAGVRSWATLGSGSTGVGAVGVSTQTVDGGVGSGHHNSLAHGIAGSVEAAASNLSATAASGSPAIAHEDDKENTQRAMLAGGGGSSSSLESSAHAAPSSLHVSQIGSTSTAVADSSVPSPSLLGAPAAHMDVATNHTAGDGERGEERRPSFAVDDAEPSKRQRVGDGFDGANYE